MSASRLLLVTTQVAALTCHTAPDLFAVSERQELLEQSGQARSPPQAAWAMPEAKFIS